MQQQKQDLDQRFQQEIACLRVGQQQAASEAATALQVSLFCHGLLFCKAKV